MRIALILLLATAAWSKTVSMREAVELAGRENPDTQIARLRALEADAKVQLVTSGYKPQLNAVISGGYQTSNLQGIGLIFPGFPSRVGPYRTFNARPALTQTVLDLGLLSQIRATRALAEASRHDADAVRELTQLTVLQLYLQSMQAGSRIQAAEARLRTATDVLQQTRERERAGSASKLDVARAEEQFQNENANVVLAKRDFDVLRSLIARTIGETAEIELDLTPPPAPNNDSPAAVRAETKALAARLRAAELDVQRAQRERLPKLSFVGDFGLQGTGPDRSLSTYTVGAALTLPIWTGGRIESEIKTAKTQADEVRKQIAQNEQSIAQELRQADIEMRASRDALASATGASAAARTSLELSRQRFAAGLSTNIDTSIAQSNLAQAEDREIQLRFDYLLARARLAHARGKVTAFFD